MNTERTTRVLPANSASIAEAAHILGAGGLVAFPTETVYGLGADARNEHAVAAIFAAKARPQFNPLIVHVANRAEAERYASMSPIAAKLADTFWPGGVTLVLPRREICPLSLLVSAGLDTVALRVPAHSIAQRLIAAAGTPIAAPSANRSGRVSPTRAGDVMEELAGNVPLVIDGGPCIFGLESTVIGFDRERPVLLRPGAVSRDAIEAIAGPLGEAVRDTVQAPGMMASHYAPSARMRLNAHSVETGEALLAFGPDIPAGAALTRNLSPRGDTREAAANLFAMLRALDESDVGMIAVMPIPMLGLGEAINDRLQRAAAPRASDIADAQELPV